MDGKVGVHLAMAVGHGGGHQRILAQHLGHQRGIAEALERSTHRCRLHRHWLRQPFAGHALARARGLAFGEAVGRQGRHERPADELGAAPSAAGRPQVHAQVGVVLARQRQMVVSSSAARWALLASR